jgi:hypothetical protein
MSSKVLKIIFVFLVAGVLLYLARSNFFGASFKSLESLSFHTSSTGSGFLGIFPPTPTSSPASNPTNYPVQTNTGAGGTSAINPAEIPAGFTAAELSPFFHEVRLGGISYGSFGSYGQITLYASMAASSTVDVTGWQIKTKQSGETLPQAVNLYTPSGLAPATDIEMHNGDNVYLYSSRGPFNLRLNECIGYIAQNNPTIPSISSYCPPIDRSEIQNFTGACQNYILSIPSCTVPDLNDIRIPINDYACRDYIANDLNYNACFNAHASDPNFLMNQIWVWMGANVADQYHDQVQLLDRNGLLVDIYNY